MSNLNQYPAILFLFASAFQGLLMATDEFYFHWRRGLGRWEQYGHPLDTITAIAVFGWMANTNHADETSVWLYALMLFSVVFVTKDELVHHKLCDAAEQWLHALLFSAHPLVFLIGYSTWKQAGFTWAHQGHLILMIGFLIYQILFWIVRPRLTGDQSR